jgi:hypothetical protein
MQKLRSARVAPYRSRRDISNKPRNVAVYLIRHLRNDTLKQVGEQFGIKKYSTVSSIFERVKYEMKADRGLKKRIQNLAENITKSQRQTPLHSTSETPPVRSLTREDGKENDDGNV